MKKTLSLFIIIFVLAPTTVMADVESWYTYWALGLVNHDHPDDLEDYLDSSDSIPGVKRTYMSIDMFGFYWPINNKTIGGFVVSGSFDSVEDKNDNYFQVNQYLYGASGMRFFGKEIGDGFFMRGDVGFTRLSTSSNFQPDDESDWGSGYLVGIGYGKPISNNTRFLFSVTFSNKFIESDKYTSTAFTVGGLW